VKREPAGLDRQSRFPRGAPRCPSEIVNEKRAESVFLTLAMERNQIYGVLAEFVNTRWGETWWTAKFDRAALGGCRLKRSRSVPPIIGPTQERP
jgi:hypothetical protein